MPVALSKIGSKIGNPMTTDKVTNEISNSAYARLLVEVDVRKDKVERVPLVLPKGVAIDVEFTYETDPSFCKKCKQIGHKAEQCEAFKASVTGQEVTRPREIVDAQTHVGGQAKIVMEGQALEDTFVSDVLAMGGQDTLGEGERGWSGCLGRGSSGGIGRAEVRMGMKDSLRPWRDIRRIKRVRLRKGGSMRFKKGGSVRLKNVR